MRDPRTTTRREIGAIIRQTADLRRLCLSIREAKDREKEAALVAEFERAVLNADRAMPVSRGVLRAGVKSLWRQARYDRIVEVARALPDDLIQQDDTVLMYYMCALRRQAEVDPAEVRNR
jgi:hypothetical protein